MRRALGAILMCLVCLMSASVCAPAASGAAPLRMTIGVVQHIGPLDPRRGTSDVAREVWNLQYPTLTALTVDDLEPQPGVASAWRPAPDGAGWIYELRDGLTWTDGQPVTADDVVYSIVHARDEQWPSARGIVDGLTAETLDPHTVLVRGPTRFANGLPSLLAHVVPAHIFGRVRDLDRDVQQLGVGAGDWHVVSAGADDVRMAVVERPGRPPLDEIVYRHYEGGDALVNALGRGDIDVAGDLPTDQFEPVQKLSHVGVIHANDGDQYVLRVHVTGNQNPLLADRRVRQAIGFAVDRTSLVGAAVDGVGRDSSVLRVARADSWNLPASESDALESQLGYAPDRAHRLLDEAGALGTTMTLSIPRDREGGRVAQRVAADLRRAGLHVAFAATDAGGLVLTRTNPGEDPTMMLQSLGCAAGWWCNPEYERPLAQYEAATDLATRLDAADAMQRLATKEQPVIVLFEPDVLQAYRRDRLAGFLSRPEDQRLVAFWPSTQAYTEIGPAAPPPGEDAGATVLIVLTVVVLGVTGLGVVLATRVRRRVAPAA